MTDRAVLPQPVAEEVLPVLDNQWRSTQDVMNRWLGRGNERLLSRHGRDRVRAEMFYLLDCLLVDGRVEMRRVSEKHCEWRRQPRGPEYVHRHNDNPASALGYPDPPNPDEYR